jgi:Ca-activated chloride channel family protein
MKIRIVGGIAALSLIMGVWAQDSQTVARPRKTPAATDADSDLPQIPSKLSPKATKGNDADPDATFKAETNVVNIDVQVLDNNGIPIPNIPRDRFRILEDNVPQTLTQFSIGEAPMTVAMVIEFSARYQAYFSGGWGETLSASYGFIQSLMPEDYVAVIAYDLRSTILSDFTDDRRKTMDAMARLRVPGFAESTMFDALSDTADRMSKIEGRKAILLISSGIDTFSKLTYDKTRKNLQEAGVPVYAIEMLQVQRIMADASGNNGNQELQFIQGDNELRTFARETGGQAFFPRFSGELPGIFRSISQSLRSQYSLGYSPNNRSKDGKFRKITVQLVNPDTSEPLRMVDEKGKPMKYTILAKSGYTAPRAVE